MRMCGGLCGCILHGSGCVGMTVSILAYMHACGGCVMCGGWSMAEDKHVTCAASSHVGSTSAASTLSLARM